MAFPAEQVRAARTGAVASGPSARTDSLCVRLDGIAVRLDELTTRLLDLDRRMGRLQDDLAALKAGQHEINHLLVRLLAAVERAPATTVRPPARRLGRCAYRARPQSSSTR